MGLFDIVYNDLPPMLMPVRYRKPRHKAWLRALINGAVTPLYGSFMSNRAANLYELSHNSQVCYLEAVLNDAFDNALRRIFIVDPEYWEPLYIYLDTEPTIVYLAMDSETTSTDFYSLYTEAEMSTGVAGFIVKVPIVMHLFDDVNNSIRLAALVNKYRLPGKSNWITYQY